MNAVQQIIDNHMPHPAMVFDHMYNVLNMNESALALKLDLFDLSSPEDFPEYAKNSIEGLFHPKGYGKYITNFSDIANFMYRRLLDEISQTGESEQSQNLLERISSYELFKKLDKNKVIEPTTFPSLLVKLSKNGNENSFYTVVSSFGAPFDVTIQNLRIELFFPSR